MRCGYQFCMVFFKFFFFITNFFLYLLIIKIGRVASICGRKSRSDSLSRFVCRRKASIGSRQTPDPIRSSAAPKGFDAVLHHKEYLFYFFDIKQIKVLIVIYINMNVFVFSLKLVRYFPASTCMED